MSDNQPDRGVLFEQAERELEGATHWWRGGNAGRGRVASRRAAGMALRAWVQFASRPGYGTSFMHHLNGAADDESIPLDVRMAAWRLAARKKPEAGWPIPLPPNLTPIMDAQLVVDWCRTASV